MGTRWNSNVLVRMMLVEAAVLTTHCLELSTHLPQQHQQLLQDGDSAQQHYQQLLQEENSAQQHYQQLLQEGDSAHLNLHVSEHLIPLDENSLHEAEMAEITTTESSLEQSEETYNSTDKAKMSNYNTTLVREDVRSRDVNSTHKVKILENIDTMEAEQDINKSMNVKTNIIGQNKDNSINITVPIKIIDDDNINKTELYKNIPSYNEPEMESGILSLSKNNKIKSGDNTATVLTDIRDALYREDTKCDQAFRDSIEQELHYLRDSSEDAFGTMSTNFERLRENMDQKIGLILETFSTLKLLVMSQGSQLTAMQEKLQGVQEHTQNFQVQIDGLQLSLVEVESKLRTDTPQTVSYYSDNILTEEDILQPQVNITHFDDKIQDTKSSLDDLTSKVKDFNDAVKSLRDELDNLKMNITGRPTSAILNTKKDATDSTTCHCISDERRHSLVKLEEVQEKQKTELNILTMKMSALESKQGEAGNKNWSYTQRVGEVEPTSFNDLTSVTRKVTALQEELNNLTQVMATTTAGATHTNNTTTEDVALEGVCVWPYRRGGGGCYHVSREERLTWQDARAHCHSLQGDLAAPLHYSQFKHFILKLRLSRTYTYWIGASTAGKDEEWKWLDGRPVRWEVWGSSQPQPLYSQCLALKPAYKFVVSAEGCGESRFYICQQERLL